MIISEQLVPGAATGDTPAIVSDGDKYILAWNSSVDQSLWWTSCPAKAGQDSYDWGKPVQIIGGASSAGPALAVFKGTTWLAFKGEGADTRIFVSSLSGSTWSPHVAIPNIGTNASPTLAATDSDLYIAYTGETDKLIYWAKSSDGKTWSKSVTVPGAETTDSPSIAANNGKISLVFLGPINSQINWATLPAGSDNWVPPVPLSYQSSVGPAVGYGNTGNLHVVFKERTDTSLWTASLSSASGSTWTAAQFLPVIKTDVRPTLASQPFATSEITLAFKGASHDDIYVGPLDNLANEQTLNYNFGIGNIDVITQRSPNRESDTLWLTMTVAVASKPPLKNTIFLGDHHYGDVFTANLNIDATVAYDEKVVFSYIMINHGGSSSSADILSSLESAGETLAKAAIVSYSALGSAAAGVALNVILPGIGAVLVPILDSALTALGGWLLGAAEGLISLISPDCDGPVAAGVHVFTGQQLMLSGSTELKSGKDNCVGVNSPDGCGSNSLYDVSWVVLGTDGGI